MSCCAPSHKQWSWSCFLGACKCCASCAPENSLLTYGDDDASATSLTNMLDSAFAAAPQQITSRRSLDPVVEDRSYAPRAAVADETKEDPRWSPSGYPMGADDERTERAHPTTLVVHPRFPRGSAHFLHPSQHLRPSVAVRIPGLPFALVVDQRHDASADATGFAVWRSAILLSTYLAQRVAPALGRARAIELGCGTGALAASVAAWLGLETHATDRPDLVASAAQSCRTHREAAASFGAPMAGPPVAVHPLEWSKLNATHYVDQHGKFDLVLGSEIVYALNGTNDELAIHTFRGLVATIDALLAPGGQTLLAWCPRSHVETYFFATLPEFHLVASPPLPIKDLGLDHEHTHGLRLVSISRQVAV